MLKKYHFTHGEKPSLRIDAHLTIPSFKALEFLASIKMLGLDYEMNLSVTHTTYDKKTDLHRYKVVTATDAHTGQPLIKGLTLIPNDHTLLNSTNGTHTHPAYKLQSFTTSIKIMES